MNDYKIGIKKYLDTVKNVLDMVSLEDINNVMNILEHGRIIGKQIYIMGNGGSASTASHFVCDFNKGLSDVFDKRFKFISLNDNIPTLMAYANDCGYDKVFVEPLKNYLNEDDIVIGISGSGNSINVLEAIKYANDNNAITIGICGYDGGELIKIAKHHIHVPINNMQVVEDIHLILDHLMISVFSQNKYNITE